MTLPKRQAWNKMMGHNLDVLGKLQPECYAPMTTQALAPVAANAGEGKSSVDGVSDFKVGTRDFTPSAGATAAVDKNQFFADLVSDEKTCVGTALFACFCFSGGGEGMVRTR